MLLTDQFDFTPTNEPTLEDDIFVLRANDCYYVQDANEYGEGYIAHNPRGHVACRTLKEAMQDIIDCYKRQNK